MTKTTMRAGNADMYGFLKKWNHNLNQKIILRNGCKIHKEVCTLQPNSKLVFHSPEYFIDQSWSC